LLLRCNGVAQSAATCNEVQRSVCMDDGSAELDPDDADRRESVIAQLDDSTVLSIAALREAGERSFRYRQPASRHSRWRSCPPRSEAS